MDTDARAYGGLVLFGMWFILLPKVSFANSTTLYDYAVLIGGSFVLAIVACVGLSVWLRSRDRTLTRPAGALAASGIIACAGLLFAVTNAPALRVAVFCIQLTAGVYSLFFWKSYLATLDHLSLFKTALAMLVTSTMLYSVILFLGSMPFLASSLYAVTALSGLILSFVPLLSWALGFTGAAPLCGTLSSRRNAGTPSVNGDRAHPYEDHSAISGKTAECIRHDGSSTRDGRIDEKTEAWPSSLSWVHITAFALGSILTAFGSGFTSSPHLFGWASREIVGLIILLIAAISFIAFTRRTGMTASGLANGFFVFALALTTLGFVFLALNVTEAAFAAHSILGAAHDCYFTLFLIFMCANARNKSSGFDRRFALGMLLTGAYWAFGAGIQARGWIGYDLDIIAPLASVSIALLSGIYSVSVFFSGPREPVNATVSEPVGETPHVITAESLDAMREEVLERYRLTPKEKQVTLQILKGFTAQTISENLFISESTVRFHLTNIYRKFDVASRGEVIQIVEQALSYAQIDR